MIADKIEKNTFLQLLEFVSPGLSIRGIIEQSNCFVFQNGWVYTYNEEIFCKTKTNLPKTFIGVIKARPVLDILRKINDDLISIDATESQFIILGKQKRIRINMETNVFLPIGDIEKPDKWLPLSENFTEAVKIVEGCAGSDTSQFVGTCIHITPKTIEATDGFQIGQFRIKNPITESILVKRDSIKPITLLDMAYIGITSKWLHFRNHNNLIYSINRYTEEYPNISEHINIKGQEATLPKGLAETVEIASIFSKENADNNLVIVSMENNKLKLVSVGVSGDYTEVKKIKYSGKPVQFTIPPQILSEISNKNNQVFISDKRLKVEGPNWKYVTTLGSPDDLIFNKKENHEKEE